MHYHAPLLTMLLLATACSEQTAGSVSTPAPSATITPTPSATATPSPTPTPTPTPSATPTPTPSPTPTPTPTPTASTYIPFGDIFIIRYGAGVTIQSACTGFGSGASPAPILQPGVFGRSLNFRWILTPQVWSITGDGVILTFDGRTAITPPSGADLAHATSIDGEPVRFTLLQPKPAAVGLVYGRLASIATPAMGSYRNYECALGFPTLPADLATVPSGGFARSTLLATAQMRDGATVRTYALDRSTVSLSVNGAAQTVTLALTLTGRLADGTGPNVALGAYRATAAIDPANGNFIANLASPDRSVNGSISGRLFGPQGVEIGAAIAGSVADAPGQPGFTFAGAAFGAR